MIVHGRGLPDEARPGASTNKYYAYISSEFQGNTNLNIECLRRTLFDICQGDFSRLPPILFVQMDNTGRENKNNIMTAFLAFLVEQGYVGEVRMHFLFKVN